MKEIIIVDKEDKLLLTIDEDSDNAAIVNDSIEIIDYTDDKLVIRLKKDYEFAGEGDIKVNL